MSVSSSKNPCLEHEIGQILRFRPEKTAEPLWVFDYASAFKPFFHPLRTPKGHVVTIDEPHDHVWHHGLWFTLKYVNGVNFWEEPPASGGPFGRQIVSHPPLVEHRENGQIALSMALDWINPNGEKPLEERRNVTFSPRDSLSYTLDFSFELRALRDLELERTPYGKFGNFGGYAGFTVRCNRNWQKTRLLFSDGQTNERPLGIGANWADLSGIFDGGSEQWGGIALFNHLENPRQSSPWYGKSGENHYLNAAFLFHKPMTLSAGETLHLRYRALVHDEIFEVEALDAVYREFCDA